MENYCMIFHCICTRYRTNVMSYDVRKLWRSKGKHGLKKQDIIIKSTVIQSLNHLLLNQMTSVRLHGNGICEISKMSKENFDFQNQNVQTIQHW